MAMKAEITTGGVLTSTCPGGAGKFLSDVWTVLEMKLISQARGWMWYLLGSFAFPMSIFYWSRALAPDDDQAARRLVAGAIVFGVSMTMANNLGQQMIQDRFQGRLKLLITMPMTKAAYVTGVLGFTAMQAAVSVALLLTFGSIIGVDLSLTWAFFPLILAVVLTMTGLTVFIASYAPTAEAGGIMINLFVFVLLMVSPVFFTVDQAPHLMAWLGWVSPLRYAADGITKSLSGSTDVWVEFGILASFALTTIALGLWKMRWRER